MTPDCVKHLGFVARKDGMTLDAFVYHWMAVHAPLVARLPGLLRYSVNLVEPGRSSGFEWDGVAELWFASWDDLDVAFASPEAAALVADGPNFVGRRLTMRCEEHHIVWP
jgi:uncharacterized protein (TIGR02118 family)